MHRQTKNTVRNIIVSLKMKLISRSTESETLYAKSSPATLYVRSTSV